MEERIGLMKAKYRRRAKEDDPIISNTQLLNYSGKKYSDTIDKMGTIEFLPNMNQYTFAVVTALNIATQERLMMCIPPG
jgi:predicted house-cleaning NTP pyrophosphatase (Maf/HAM1 superfamily)